MGIIDVFVFGCGVYILYHSYIMRSKGVLPKGIMVNKDVNIPKDADVAGFILDMYWKGLIVGASACLSGLFGMLSVEIEQLQMLATIFSIAFFGVLIAFMFFLKKAQKKFLHM